MFQRIDHVEIIPSNPERTINFYTDVLGFHIQRKMKIEAHSAVTELVFLELNDTLIEVLSVTSPAPVTREQWQVGYRGIALTVDDVDKAVAYLKGKGVRITREPISSGKSRRAEIVDPDGLPIELKQALEQ